MADETLNINKGNKTLTSATSRELPPPHILN